MSDDAIVRERQRAFFGRRKGHPLRARHNALFETLLPRLAVRLEKPAPADLSSLFAHPVAEIRLEIGYGGGEHLIAQATAHPNLGFVGSDGFENAVAKLLAATDENKLTNIRLHYGDAGELLSWLPARSLSRIDLLYPDPWPKRRHWKRRFVQDGRLAAIARLLKRNGEFRFATDIADYATWTLARVLRSADFEWTAESADDWRRPWPGFTRTRYEAKALREGRTPAYYIFRKR